MCLFALEKIKTITAVSFCQYSNRNEYHLSFDVAGGYWRSNVASRPITPPMADNASDASSMMPPAGAPRPKSRAEMATSRYGNLSYWKARRVVFYKNGDPFFPGIEFR